MKSNLLMDFSVDKEQNKIRVTRTFEAPLANVWAAWTESRYLDQWWAPKPWRAQTKTMDFRDGGHWLYAMVGPDGEEQWCRADYTSVRPMNSYSAKDAFCDPNGVIDAGFPRSVWQNEFRENGQSTTVSIEITYEKLADLEKYIEMGFREGFTMAMENLDELIASKQI